jgi:hypothetical protein
MVCECMRKLVFVHQALVGRSTQLSRGSLVLIVRRSFHYWRSGWRGGQATQRKPYSGTEVIESRKAHQARRGVKSSNERDTKTNRVKKTEIKTHLPTMLCGQCTPTYKYGMW